MRIFGIAVVCVSLATIASLPVSGTRDHEAVSLASHAALPALGDAERLLNATPRHREWLMVPNGASDVSTFVVYPERSDKAPLVVLTARDGVTDDWLRAVGDQLAAHGFVAAVPDLSGGSSANVVSGPGAVVVDAAATLARTLPSTTGDVLRVVVDRSASLVEVQAGHRAPAAFGLTPAEWSRALAYLGGSVAASVEVDPHAGHRIPSVGARPIAAAQDARGGRPGGQGGGGPAGGAARGGGGLANKDPKIVASIWNAASTVARTKLRHEWVDIPIGAAKLHTWIEYPEGDAPAPVVIVMQHGPGMDMWVRGVADQLASEGFIAVAPDLFSGFGPNGGNYDSFKTPDEAMRVAGPKITADESIRRYLAARTYAMKLPRANGKSGSIGFCAGGGFSFRFAAEVPDLNAAVVFYGTAPDEAALAKVRAPVLGLYGEDDARITATVEPTAAAMKRLGKSFESHIYPGATHAFLLYQVEGRNQPATLDSWPRATAFLKQHLR